MTNAFVGKQYVDGDKDWDAPEWRQLMDKELLDGQAVDFEKDRQVNYYIHQDEVGFKHPKTGATLKLRDDGAIEMFVNEDTGLRLNPADNSVVIYGDNLHIVSKDTHVHTRPDGFSWNGNTFNPALYYEDEKNPLPTFQSTAGKTHKIFSGKDRKSLYDTKVIELLGNLGIEVEKR